MAEWLDKWRAFAESRNPWLNPEKERLPQKPTPPGLIGSTAGAIKSGVAQNFPQASLLMGGPEEINRRLAIEEKYPARPIGVANTASVVTNKPLTPSPAEEAARRTRMPVNTIATPQGVANIQRGTGVVEAPITNPQEAERSRIAGIKGRISPENLYRADVVGGNMRTGQIRVGAATDAEAARNLQSRAEQDAAVQGMVASFDRSTEALRGLRAERQGISRNALDIQDGRVQAPQTTSGGQEGGNFGDEILDRDRFLRQFQAPLGALGRAKRQAQANTIAAQEVWNQDQQARQKQAISPQAPAVNPLDMQRFLLDQQKFGWQQGVDEGRLATDMAKVKDSQSGTELQKQKYADERRKAFMDTFSYPDEKAPREQLGALVLSLSDATDGQIPPELMTGYIQKAAEEAGVDWEDAPPKSLTALGKRAMELAALDNR